MESDGHDSNFSVVTSDRGDEVSYIFQGCEDIPAFIVENYSESAIRLDLSYNHIRSLKQLEPFSKLQELVLDNNNVSHEVSLPLLASLNTLTLNNNHVSNVERLSEALRLSLPNLRYLSLIGNPGYPGYQGNDGYQDYRRLVVSKLPNLRFLDSSSVSQQERRNYRPRKTSHSHNKDRDTYSPLPESNREPSDHKGVFAQSRYVYYGKQSEGNRFIFDRDL